MTEANPYRTSKDDPSMGRSLRLTRWGLLLAVAGVLIFGIFKAQADVRAYDTLLSSPDAVTELGIVSDVRGDGVRARSGGQGRNIHVTVITASGKEHIANNAGRAWIGSEGDAVRVTTHPDTEAWFMNNIETDASTENQARNGSTRLFILGPSIILGLVAVGFGYRRIKAYQWDRQHRGH